MKKSIALLITLGMIFVSLIVSGTNAVNAAEGKEESYEIAVILDSSGSMNTTDRDRLCIEAAKEFAYLYPSYCEFKINLIVYNSAVGLAYSGIVNSETEMMKYENTVDRIKGNNLEIDGKIFTCWKGATYIGSALKKAQDILSKSSATKKAVMMFTDGMPEGNGEEELALTVSPKLRESGIPVFAVGLYTDEATIKNAEPFLNKVTGGDYFIANDSTQLMDYFSKIYAKLLGNDVTKSTDVDVTEGEEQTYSFHIYGGVVREVNILINSADRIYDIRLTNSEKTIDVDNLVASDKCKVNVSSNVTNIKIINPVDGKWTLKFKSASTRTISIGEIHLHDVTVYNALQNAEKIAVGDTLELCVSLINSETNTRIPGSSSVFTDSLCEVLVSDGEKTVKYNGVLNKDKNGFDCKVIFDKSGTYTYKMRIYNDIIDIASAESVIQAVTPSYVMTSPDKATCGAKSSIGLQVVNPLNNSNIKYDSLTGTLIISNSSGTTRNRVDISGGAFEYVFDVSGENKISLELNYAGEVIGGNSITVNVIPPQLSVLPDGNSTQAKRGDKTGFTVNVIDSVTGKIINKEPVSGVLTVVCGEKKEEYSFVSGKSILLSPGFSGTCRINAEAVYNGMKLTGSLADFEFLPSVITVAEEKPNGISGRYANKPLVFEYDLDKYFKTSDGAKLYYSIAENTNKDKINAEISGSSLKVTVNGSGSGTVKLHITDNMGAELLYELDCNVSSIGSVILIICIIILSLAVIAVITYFLIGKEMIIKTGFQLKIEYSDIEGNESELVYSVQKFTSVQSAKKKMSLTEILCNPSLCATTDEESYGFIEEFKDDYGTKVILSGIPFKKGFVIRNLNTAKSKNVEFKGSVVSIKIKAKDGGVYKLYFGKPGKFNRDDID